MHGVFVDGEGNKVSGGSATFYVFNSSNPSSPSSLATIYSTISGGSAVSGSVVTTDDNGAYLAFIDEVDYMADQVFSLVLSKSTHKTVPYHFSVGGLNTFDVPTITDFTNAAHDHSTAAEGGFIDAPYMKVTDSKAQNTGGGTFTSGSWQTRTLNTEVIDTGGHLTLASNQITLVAGTYYCKISVPAHRVDSHMAKLVNATAASDIFLGTSEYSANVAAYAQTRSYISGRFTIAASQALEVQHICGTTYASTGFGVPSNLDQETYTVVEFWRLA